VPKRGGHWALTGSRPSVGAARLLLRAAHKEADPGDTARLPKPVGIGPRAQRDLCAWELGAQINDSEAEEAMKEITAAGLADCWGYGFTYAHARCPSLARPHLYSPA
jgi:hypothetical protein